MSGIDLSPNYLPHCSDCDMVTIVLQSCVVQRSITSTLMLVAVFCEEPMMSGFSVKWILNLSKIIGFKYWTSYNTREFIF